MKMKITDKQLEEFFPKDHRFLYYCANRFGMTVNENNLDDAVYHSYLNVLALRDKEFENEQHLYGYVMNAFKYAIKKSYTMTRDYTVVYESELIKDEDSTTAYDYISEEDKEYEDNDEYQLFVGNLKTYLNPLQQQILDYRLEGYSRADTVKALDCSDRQYDIALMKIKKVTKEDGYTKRKADRKSNAVLEQQERDRVAEIRETAAEGYSEAMSWLCSE